MIVQQFKPLTTATPTFFIIPTGAPAELYSTFGGLFIRRTAQLPIVPTQMEAWEILAVSLNLELQFIQVANFGSQPHYDEVKEALFNAESMFNKSAAGTRESAEAGILVWQNKKELETYGLDVTREMLDGPTPIPCRAILQKAGQTIWSKDVDRQRSQTGGRSEGTVTRFKTSQTATYYESANFRDSLPIPDILQGGENLTMIVEMYLPRVEPNGTSFEGLLLNIGSAAIVYNELIR